MDEIPKTSAKVPRTGSSEGGGDDFGQQEPVGSRRKGEEKGLPFWGILEKGGVSNSGKEKIRKGCEEGFMRREGGKLVWQVFAKIREGNPARRTKYIVLWNSLVQRGLPDYRSKKWGKGRT